MLRPDLIHRPGVGTSLGKSGVMTSRNGLNRSSSTVRLTRWHWWHGGRLGARARRAVRAPKPRSGAHLRGAWRRRRVPSD